MEAKPHERHSITPVEDSVGNALKRREELTPSLLYLLLVHQAVQCPLFGKQAAVLWEASILSSWSLGCSGSCLSLVPQASQVLTMFLFWVAHWRTRKLTFASHKVGGERLSVWSWSQLDPEEVDTQQNKNYPHWAFWFQLEFHLSSSCIPAF